MPVIRKKVTRAGEGGVKYICDECGADITSTVRIECAVCQPEVVLCVQCFSKGVCNNPQNHDPAKHPYRVIEQNSFPIYEEEWGADEELLLIEGCEMYGLGSWADISDHIGGYRSKEEVRDHYLKIYVESEQFPLPERCSPQDMELASRIPREEFQSRKKRRIEERKEAAKNEPPLQPKTKPTASGPTCHELQGFMPGRLEFETEYANDAEEAVQLMQFDPGDGINPRTGEIEAEMDLKLTVMDIYNARLSQRVERKKVMFEHNLLEYRENTKNEKKRTKEEKDIINKAKPFARMMNHDDFEDFSQGLVDELNLKQAIAQLQDWRGKRIADLKMGEKYEADKSQRIQRNIPMGSMDRERLATTQRNKANQQPEPPSGAALLVAEELPLAFRPVPEVFPTKAGVPGVACTVTGALNGATTNGNGIATANGGAPVKTTIIATADGTITTTTTNGAPQPPAPPPRAKHIPPPIASVPPLVLTQQNAADLHLLSAEERKLCEICRIQPKPYLVLKDQILKMACAQGGNLKRRQVKDVVRLDSQKGGRIFDFFVHAGWIGKA